MGAVAAVEVAIGLFFGLVASGLNVFVSPRCASICEFDGQDCAIPVEPMTDLTTRSFQSGGSIAIEGASEVSGNRARERLKGGSVKSLGGVLDALGPRSLGSGHYFLVNLNRGFEQENGLFHHHLSNREFSDRRCSGRMPMSFQPHPTLSQSLDLPKVDDFLQELASIQQTGSKRIAILGSRHVPITHQKLIEMMIFALVSEGNRVLTSGSTGTNFAVIRGALRADPSLLTVILPQSLDRQPRESREQLEMVMHLVEHPDNNELSLGEASSMCNQEIISRCQQLICFAFHDSRTLLQTCRDAEEQRKLVTIFYLD